WAGKPRFAPRRIVPIEVSYSEDERRAHRLLSRYGDLRRKRAGDDKLSQISVEFVLKTLKKRLFSSPSAFASTLWQHIETVNAPERRAKVTPVLKDLRARLDAADEPTETDEEAEEITLEAFSAAEDVATIGDEEREVL